MENKHNSDRSSPDATAPRMGSRRLVNILLLGLCAVLSLGCALSNLGPRKAVRRRPTATRQRPTAMLWRPTATPDPQRATEAALLSTSPTGEPEPAGSYFSVVEWPAPPGKPVEVTLPPPVKDQAKLDEAQRLYEQGKAAFDAKRWQEAVYTFNRALEINPRHAEAYNYRGEACIHLGPHNVLEIYLKNHDQAIADFTRAIAINPNWGLPYRNRGSCYSTRASLEPFRDDRRPWSELALADYDRCVELEGDRTPANCNRAGAYAALGLEEKVLQEALLCPCDTTLCLSVIASAYMYVEDYEQALHVIEQWQSDDAGDPSLYWTRGQVYVAQGKYDLALDEFETAEQKWEGDFTPGALWFDRAEAEYYLGQYDQAKDHIERGLPNTWLDWGKPYYYLGMIYLQEGKTQEAIEAFSWAEQTLGERNPLLAKTREELGKLGQ